MKDASGRAEELLARISLSKESGQQLAGALEFSDVLMRSGELTDQRVSTYDEREIPIGHLAGPKKAAQVVAFLISDEAPYVVGATFDVNAGLAMP